MEERTDTLDQLVCHRREELRKLGPDAADQAPKLQQIRQGSGRKWGLALSGGGIRSATFSFGVLRSLAANRLLLRFDLLSTVSGEGYVGGMLGRLFDRAGSPEDAAKVQDAMGRAESTWFGWWLRSNGSYLAPAGGKDRLFAMALYLRNLFGVHFEFALIGLLLGLALAGFNLLVWGGLMVAGYHTPGVLAWIDILEPWFATPWILAPLVILFAVNYSFAYWQLPWARSATLPRLILQAGVTAFIPCIPAAVLWRFDGDVATIGLPARDFVAFVTATIGVLVLTSTWTARRAAGGPRATTDAARNELTRRLANTLRLLALVIVAGAIDRIAWWIAFESFATIDLGIALGVAVAILRSVLPLGAATKRPTSKTAAKLIESTAQLLGFALTFVLIVWWVSVVQKVVLGAIFVQSATTGPTPLVRDLSFVNGWVYLVGIAIPILLYAMLTGRNLEFLNLSSLHAFYRARLVRAYLGAANSERFGPGVNALDDIPACAHTTTRIRNVGEVHQDDDVTLADYQPHKHGGPVHIINTCVNQTADPKGRLFNRDRKGLLLSVVAGGISQLSQEGWRKVQGIGTRSLGTWLAASGAAVAPGLGSRTQRGLSALLTFAGVRLGFWLTRSARNGSPARLFSFGKSKGLVAEMLGTFRAGPKDDWFLSDGGHFENTGAYALLAEHAEFIVLVDCGADPNYEFGDIENLVRKARIDLGAEIHFQKPIRAACEVWHEALQYFGSLNELASADRSACIALARVSYPGDTKPLGVLVVIKPNVCQALPMDVSNYRQDFPDFPQQGTANQFFSEAQWESYFQLGKFLADKLSPDFVQALLIRPEKYFEKDVGALASSPAAQATNHRSTRIPARIGVAAVGATLGAGAVATIGVSVWQAADSARAAVAARAKGERDGMKELADIWSRLPPVPEPDESDQSKAERQALYDAALKQGRSDPVATLAAAVVRNADSLCASGEAQWLQESPLGLRIVGDAVNLCRLQGEKLSPACFVLLTSNIGPVPAPYMSCLAPKTKAQHALYWGYDYSRNGTWQSLHPCSSERQRMLEEERVFRGRTKWKSNALLDGSALKDIRDIGLRCRPIEGSELVEVRAADATDNAQIRGASLANGTAVPTPKASPSPDVLPSPTPSPSPTERDPLQLPSADEKVRSMPVYEGDGEKVCSGNTVFIQVYDSSDRDIVRNFREWWRSWGASVPPIEDVNDTARRSGRANPTPVSSSVFRYHDKASEACALQLAAGLADTFGDTAAMRWKVEPLAAGLRGSRGTIEVWVKPGDALLDNVRKQLPYQEAN